MPRDQQQNPPARQTTYEGLAYLGEYPLAWAACCANEAVYNLLLDSDADPDAQDSFGNMILHMVVVCDKLVRIVVITNYTLNYQKLLMLNVEKPFLHCIGNLASSPLLRLVERKHE